ncbi:MAG: DUF4293 domain-containing protein [Muribaculaceae bacterium]|nr:DUF4293 family protein [Muribaculaceae bacterium]MCI9054422.1 DUF4293 domain-containing protein [Muribaculaceae bacterium]
MQIQRIQTLMLLIAAIFIGVFCFTPFATVAAEGAEPTAMFVKDAPVLLILNIVVAALLLITIFMYHNLRQQMKMTILAIVLICASMVTSGFVIGVGMENATPVLLGGVVLLVLALLFALLAYRGMKRDHKLLRSMDRLR